MQERTIRTAMICPTEVVNLARGLSAALNEGYSFAIPLSSTGESPATHYGLSALVSDKFLGLILQYATLAQSDGLDVQADGEFNAEALAKAKDRNVKPGQVTDVLSQFTVIATRNIDTVRPLAQFNSLLASMGLQRIQEEV